MIKTIRRLRARLKLLLALLVFVSLIFIFQILFLNKIYPGIYISGTKVGTLTAKQADDQIRNRLSSRINSKLGFFHEKDPYFIQISEKNTFIDTDEVISKALEFGRRKIYLKPVNLDAKVYFNKNLDSQIEKIAADIDQPALNSQIRLLNDSINVTPSKTGTTLDKDKLKEYLSNYINTGSIPSNGLPLKTTYPKLSYEKALEIKKTLDQIRLNPITLHYEERSWKVDIDLVMSIIDLENDINPSGSGKIPINPTNSLVQPINIKNENRLIFSQEKLEEFLSKIALEIDRPVEEPLFSFDGQRVTEFRPPVNGKKLDIKKSAVLIYKTLSSENQKNIELPVEVLTPKNRLTDDLGIKELIGRGKSNFQGSIENRIYNIGLATSKLNGILIKPDEIFSFNATVGDISAASGYKQAYVIKSGRTVLDDGGGVCQVSTTLFRSVLNSGLPVIERVAHAYRVGYYEQGFPPGLDATIFSPSVDFKFKNDTLSHILIQAYTLGNTLYIDFYGTNDGRIVNLTRPIITNQTPPPPELRQDDPTLPKGTIKQVDFAASGANVVFSRTVTRNGETIINESFRSNYRPWQAIYLVGTKDN